MPLKTCNVISVVAFHKIIFTSMKKVIGEKEGH